MLSSDAVRIRPGAAELQEQSGGDDSLKAKVWLIEPSAFTKRNLGEMLIIAAIGTFRSFGQGNRK